MGIGVAYKRSDGTETGTFTVTTADTSNNDSAFILLSIPGAHLTTAPEAGSFATGTGAANPASFDPSWGTEDTLWIAVAGSGETSTTGSYTGLTSAPTNFGDYFNTGISADAVGGVEGAVAFRQQNAATQDVGAFTGDTSNARDAALVIAIRPDLTQSVTLDLIDSGSAIYAPTVIQDQFIDLGLIDAGSAIYAPTLSAAAQTVTLGLIQSGGTVGLSYDSLVASDAPVAYYRLGEPSGSVIDQMGGTSGSAVGGITRDVTGALVSGDDGAITLDGVDGEVTVAHHAALNTGDVFTLEAWIKRAALGVGADSYIFSKGDGNYRLGFNNDGVEIAQKAVAIIAISTVQISDTTTWHHIVWTKNGATSKIYIDGIDRTGTVTNQTISDTSDTLEIGNSNGGFFEGSVDEAAIYDYALTSGQVRAHYHLGSADYYASVVAADSPVAHYRMDGDVINVVTGHNNGAGSNSPTQVAGLLNNSDDGAYSFNGPDSEFVDIGESPYPFPTGDTSRTVEAWIQTSAAGADNPIFTYGGYSGTLRTFFTIIISSGNQLFWTDSVTFQAFGSAGALNDGELHQVILTWDGTNLRVYIDTVEQSNSPLALGAALATSTDNAWIATNGSAFATVIIDEVSVYATAFSPAQIAEHYEAGTATAGGSAIYAPIVVQSNSTIQLGLIDSGSAIYAPTVTTVNTILLDLIDSGSAIYAPTVVATYTIALGLIDSGSAIYAPTVISDQFITLDLIDSGSAIYAPSLSHTIALGLIDSGSAIYAPSLSPTIALGLIDSGSAIYALTVSTVNLISIGLVDATSAIYAPTVTAVNTITLGLIDSGSAIYAPTVISDQFVTLDLIDSGSAIYSPTVTTGATIVLGLIDSGSAIYAPSLSHTIALGLVTSTSAIYAPSLSHTIALGVIDSGSAVYAPSLSHTISLGVIDSGSAIYAPTVTAKNTISLGLIDSGAAIYAPTVDQITTLTVILPLIDSGSDIYAPLLAQGGAIDVPLIDAGSATYAPTLVTKYEITLGLIDGANAIYAPALTTLNVITLGLIDSGSETYAPSVGFTISLGRIDSTAEAYAPSLQQIGSITLGLIDSGPAIYAVTLYFSQAGWKWVNSSQAMARPREQGWPELQEGYARPRKNHGEN